MSNEKQPLFPRARIPRGKAVEKRKTKSVGNSFGKRKQNRWFFWRKRLNEMSSQSSSSELLELQPHNQQVQDYGLECEFSKQDDTHIQEQTEEDISTMALLDGIITEKTGSEGFDDSTDLDLMDKDMLHLADS